MPLFFFIVGFILIDSGFRGNAQALFQQFESDAKGFLAFFAVICILGACGFSSALRPIAKGLLILVFVVFFVRKGNQIVAGLKAAVSGTGSASASLSSATSGAAGTSSIVGSVASDLSSVSSDVSNIDSDAGTASDVLNLFS